MSVILNLVQDLSCYKVLALYISQDYISQIFANVVDIFALNHKSKRSSETDAEINSA